MKYYYDKYTTKLSDWSSETIENSFFISNDNTVRLWKSEIFWDFFRGVYYYEDDDNWEYQQDGTQIPVATELEATWVDFVEYKGFQNDINAYLWDTIIHKRIRTKIKDNYIETIQAEEGTLPNDGEKDGYWYIKKAPVMSAIYLVLPNEKLMRIPLYQVTQEEKLVPRYVYQVVENEKLKRL